MLIKLGDFYDDKKPTKSIQIERKYRRLAFIQKGLVICKE
jgi:hypothetical protein